MPIDKDLQASYVMADDLYEWQKTYFPSFADYKQWLETNGEATESLEDERMYRVIQRALSGLVTASASGSAAATAQLKSLTGMSRPVGRPRGTTNQPDEAKLNIMLNDLKAYEEDVARMQKN